MSLVLQSSGGGSVTLEEPVTASNFTITVPAVTGTMAIQGPAFGAVAGGSQAISYNTFTKVQINTENFDAGSCFDTSNYRFTPNVAGYYQINGSIFYNLGITSDYSIVVVIAKNGAEYSKTWSQGGSPNGYYGASTSTIVYCNGTTDYIELYTSQLFGSTQNLSAGTGTNFSGALVRAA
jgi:hypothetical protein